MMELLTERRAAERRATALPLRSDFRLPAALVRCALALALAACSTTTPSIGGSPAVSPAPGTPYVAPKSVVPPEPDSGNARKTLPSDLAARDSSLTLADVVDVSLRNNPQTALAWSKGRTAAYEYGSARGTYFPAVDATANVGRSQSTTQTGFVERTQFAPLVSLSYLLLDFGGRSGTIGAARENTVAVNLDYNATLQTVVLQAESAYFAYISARALAHAQEQTLAEADTNLQAAKVRHTSGVATIADVLQAQTVFAQAQLDLETDSGAVKTSHSNLATAMGLRADADFEVVMPSDSLPIGSASDGADSLIVSALANRPDMAAARVTILQSQQQVRVARSAEYPALTVGANLGRNYSNLALFAGNNYALTLGVTIPIFNGFGHQYDLAAAKSRVDEQVASTNLLRTQVSSQVVTSYVNLHTAAARVRTADVLLASAKQSEDVARGRYKAGVGTILDLLTAQSALASARAQQTQTRWTWATALAQLAHDVGVLGVHGETPIALTHDSTTGPR
ncbi:MAG: TolC family protein [Gemmatimonadaceae bacterium]|nr:TolC family protein [Gemmatimonadaceae bacterium]